MRTLLTLGILLFTSTAWAGLPKWNYATFSSYTVADTKGAVLFSSANIRWIGITVGLEAAGNVAIFRSTSPTFTTNLGTQTLVDTSDSPHFFPMHDVYNGSYTYIHKNGTAKVTYWYRCTPSLEGSGVCPGLKLGGGNR